MYKSITLAWILILLANPARAEVSEVRIAFQYGLSYLTLMVMEDQHLLEKKAQQMRLGQVQVRFDRLGGPGNINDALLSESADFGAVGVPSLVLLWAKTKGSLNYKAVGALNSLPMYLNTSNPRLKSLKDLSDQDKIALPSVKVSVQAVTFQMAVAKTFGTDHYKKLDHLTVSMTHPDGMISLLSGHSEVTAHFTAPPFQYYELAKPGIHRLLNSYDVLGGKATFTLMVASTRFREQNPKIYAAFVASYQEATDWIRGNKKSAASFYIKANKTKDTAEQIQKMLEDPEIEFTLVPRGIMKYAEFMHQVGTIKIKPDSWKDLTHPNLHSMSGS